MSADAKTFEAQPLHGARLVAVGMVLALANFMVILDVSIANVSVQHIGGSLGISMSQGTWIITSYSVAEAICVPLTGWLANRFGTVRTFCWGMFGFGVFSMLCGVSNSLGMLVACRIGQGLCGGPIMPLSQTLLMRAFPREKLGQAMAIWAMTTVIAPILGPILGGSISDSWSWHWIFFINVPVVLACIYGALRLLRSAETPTFKLPIDIVGLVLLVTWVGALQIMLDIGREHDWFNDGLIVTLALIAGIGLALFIAWELTDAHPVVDLRVLRHRSYTVAVTAFALCYSVFFGTFVLIPMWLQSTIGYTSTDAGYVTAFMGMGALIMSPVVAKLGEKVDARILGTFGIGSLAVISLLRVHWTSGADFWTLAMPQIVQGFAMPFYFITLTSLALSSVEPEETASAAGIMSFSRTLAGAFGASIITTSWDNEISTARSEIVSRLGGETYRTIDGIGLPTDQARGMLEMLVQQEAMTLAANHVFLVAAIMLAGTALIIWLSRRPARPVDASAVH